MFDFGYQSANGVATTDVPQGHDPWAAIHSGSLNSTSEHHGSPFSAVAHSPLFAAATTTSATNNPFLDVTNNTHMSSWPLMEKRSPHFAKSSEANCSPIEASPFVDSNHNMSGDMMLVKGEFLCASKLLQMAHAHPLDRTQSTVSTDLDDSPSRDSTPMDVANSVLYGDDSPQERADPPPRSITAVTATGNRLTTAASTTAHTIASLQREYSCFSVSAGTSSRDPTPTTPNHDLGSAFTTKLFPPTAQGVVSGRFTVSQQHPSSKTSSVSSSSSPAGMFESSKNMTPAVAQPSSVELSARRAVRSHHVTTVAAPVKPTILELTAPQTCVLVLEFKMERKLRCRCSIPNITTANAVGQYFIVNVDTSGLEDAGMCTAVVPMNNRHILQRQFGHSDQGTIVRMANATDCDVINDVLPQLEEHALAACHDLIHFLHLPFMCVDAEYSFDQKGCKMYYVLAPQACTSNAPNVSRLQRELGVRLKCRIVMEQAHSGPAAAVEAQQA